MKLSVLMPLNVESVATVASLGYDGIEVGARWVDSSLMDEIEANLSELQDVLQENGVSVTSVAIYGNTIGTPVDDAVAYYHRAMRLARSLGCSVVSGLTGRDNSLTVEENVPLFKERFAAIAARAQDTGVRIALEPWPGSVLGHGPYRWTNMATTPELWEMLFEAVPNPALGLEYDPSHLVWQEIDHLRAIRDFASRIHHVHAKDIVIDRERLAYVGVHGRGWWRFVLPGLGQIDWTAVLAALAEVGYRGDVAVEHEDREYLGERWNEGLAIAHKTLGPLVASFNA